MINVISRYGVLDSHFKERLAAGKVYICEKHFSEGKLEYTSEFTYLFLFQKCYANIYHVSLYNHVG